MKKAAIALILCGCLSLSACAGVFNGQYVSVQPHEQPSPVAGDGMIEASDYEQLYDALTELVETGTEEGVISVAKYRQERIEADMQQAVEELCRKHPVAAYAVKEIAFDLGSRGGTALAVTIAYVHDRAEIQKISQVENIQEAIGAISGALNRCEAGIVLHIKEYEDIDFIQVVESYALYHPELVMEQPRTAVNIYPESGKTRVVEVKFTYQTSRDSLKKMQTQVQPVFDSAVLYVSGDAKEGEKYSQLCSFLMERYDYQEGTSITPTYSLLRHGVGDSRAFAMVYAAMCRQAGLECIVVPGTYNGESRYWNIINDDGIYYHIDLLRDGFKKRKDKNMDDYVWDYSAYPACGVRSEE